MSNPVESLKSSIVRFYHANGNVVGAGFLVAERYVLTCAHVVEAALSPWSAGQGTPHQAVQLDFPLLAPENYLEASVVLWMPVSTERVSEDLAVLQLLTPPPNTAEPLLVAAAPNSWEHSLTLFGFPKGHRSGMWATGTFRGPTDKGWIQWDAKIGENRPIEKGFSGAPIWDEQLKAVVGITVAAERKLQPSVTSAYMIPQELLRKPLNYVRQQTLLDILQKYEAILRPWIQLAYGLCRSQNAITAIQQTSQGIVKELANATAGAQQTEDKLVQFAVALVLELETQPMELLEAPKKLLHQWGCRYAKDFEAAKATLQAIEAKRQEQKIEPRNPMLLVNIQEDPSRDSLSVEAWAVLDPDKYNARTLQGSRRLLFFPEAGEYAHLSEQNVAYGDLPILLESYLMQMCNGFEYECDPSELTLYLVLPPSLVNEPLERLMPENEDEPLGIGENDCLQVILALQNRADLGGFRASSRWKKAWKLKNDKADVPAHVVFADSKSLKDAEIVGFQKVNLIEFPERSAASG